MTFELTADVPERLRKALHLVHCLQKERGASCSYYAYIKHHKSSFGLLTRKDSPEEKRVESDDTLHESQNRDEAFRISAMRKAKKSTDAAYQLFFETAKESHINWDDVLLRIRASMEKHEVGAMANNSVVDSHRILVWFSLFITSIINESVEQIIKKEQKIVKQAIESKTPKTYSLPRRHRRTNSDDVSLRKLRSRRTASCSIPMESIQSLHQHRKTFSDIDNIISRKTKTCSKSCSYTYPRSSPDDSNSSLNTIKPSLSYSTLTIFSDEGENAKDENEMLNMSNNGKFKDLEKCKDDGSFILFADISGLLTLLYSFVRLKESTGTERAILSVLMTIGMNDTDHECFRLFSDLVIQIENQRQIIRKIRKQTQDPLLDECETSFNNNFKTLLTMVDKFVEPNREMLQLQAMIDSFDLKGLQHLMTWKKFWNIISLYMDQLHSLELLIVEELQGAWVQAQNLLEKSHSEKYAKTGNAINQVSSKVIHVICDYLTDRLHTKNAFEDLIQMLSSVSPEELKQAVLCSVKDKTITLRSQPETSMKQKQDGNSPFLPTPSESLKEWDIDLYEIEFCQRIGRGVAGTTYLANWSGQKVAVKVAAFNSLGIEGWQAEVESLKQLHHPNIIRLLGSIYNPSPQTYGIVLEFCERGDLQSALRKETPSIFFWRIADDVANGMAYLHRKNILHRDIKPANILLTGDMKNGHFNAKLTDFGLAIKLRESPDVELTAETGTYRWMAPEVIRHENYSFMADVYSFGIVLWQLVTHEDPFQDISQVEAASKVAIYNERPPFPIETPKYVKGFIENCWDRDPRERLNFSTIPLVLKEIRSSITVKELKWLSCPQGHPMYNG